MADKMLKVTLVKSTIGAVPKNRKTVESMGLRKLHHSIILEEVVDMVRVMVRQPVRDTRVRRPVPEHPESVLKAARCLYTDVSPREVSRTETPRRSWRSMSACWSALKTALP